MEWYIDFCSNSLKEMNKVLSLKETEFFKLIDININKERSWIVFQYKTTDRHIMDEIE